MATSTLGTARRQQPRVRSGMTQRRTAATTARPPLAVGTPRHPGAASLDVTVVVVTHNSASTVAATLRSIPTALASSSHEVIVVDNASTDDSLEVAATAAPQATIVRSPLNQGFSRASNRGIRRSRGRWVLLLNPDTVCPPGSLDEVVRAADSDPAIGVAAPAVTNPDGSDQGTARRFPTPAAALFGRRSPLTRWFPGNRWSRRYSDGILRSSSEPYDVDWVSGACLLVRRRLLDVVGPMDARYFLYWEDADLCRRVRDAGRRVVTVPTAAIVHDEGAARVGWPARRILHFHASAYRFHATHDLTGRRQALRPLAGAALAARAAALLVFTGARRATARSGSRP